MWTIIFPEKMLNNTGKIKSNGNYKKQMWLKTSLDGNQRVNRCWFDSFHSFSMSVGHERWKEAFDQNWQKCTFHWQTMQKKLALLMLMEVYDITWTVFSEQPFDSLLSAHCPVCSWCFPSACICHFNKFSVITVSSVRLNALLWQATGEAQEAKEDICKYTPVY